MQYRLVYDVLNARFPWLGVFFACVPLLLALVVVVEIFERARGKPRVPMPVPRVCGRLPLEATPLPFLILFLLLSGFAGVFFASLTYGAAVGQWQCQEWLQAGQYEVAEGTITNYHSQRGEGTSFRVAGLSVHIPPDSVGFTGRFNVGREAGDSLRDRLHVRLAHRAGFILRVEIASAQEAMAGSGQRANGPVP
jgi:hypothetical protein